jgi:OPA family glycerol-3-phosphate transporter-like MFS transporter
MIAATESRDFRRWSSLTMVMLVVGYAGYYLCRSHFSIAKPYLMEAYPGVVTKDSLGLVASVGTLLYAFGKFGFGSLADAWSGKRLFLLGMVGAVLATILFAAGGPPIFLAAWALNRAIQSAGWVGMVKIGSRWFAGNTYGRAMAIVSLSYLFGDFVSRKAISGLFAAGMAWQNVFYVAAGVLALMVIPIGWFLRDRPEDRNLPEPAAGEKTQFAVSAPSERISPVARILRLVSDPAFLVVCALSFSFTFMRETFNDWIPTYLHEAAGMTKEAAGDASSYFPLFGGLSVIAVGFLSDRFRKSGAAVILAAGLGLGTLGLFALSQPGGDASFRVMLTAAIAFALIGPYSLLAGAISLDFGGKDASSTAAGWIDGIGYLGGILSGSLIAGIATKQGWGAAFQVLAGTAAVNFVIAVAYIGLDARRSKSLSSATESTK